MKKLNPAIESAAVSFINPGYDAQHILEVAKLHKLYSIYDDIIRGVKGSCVKMKILASISLTCSN
jgi:hypothetical protein